MSSLSDQQPSSLFSEYSELSLAPGGAPQSWDWQHKAGKDISGPRALLVGGGGPLTPTPLTSLTDEDKLCLFERQGDGDIEMKGSGIPLMAGGSVHISLGSAGESPDSPPSSSPSPSPGSSMGCLTPSPALGLQVGISLPLAPGLPCVDPPSAPAHGGHYPVGTPLIGMCPAGGISPTKAWSDSNFGDVSMLQQVPGDSRRGVIDNNYMEEQEEMMAGAEVTPDARQLAKGSSPDESEEEEEEEQEELRPCFMGRAEQQRKAMRRAMSECSHLSVPSSLDLPDKYPGGEGPDNLASPAGVGLRRSPHASAMKRSLTVAEDQQPPPTLSAAGTTRADLRHEPPEPRLSPFLSPKDGSTETRFPLSPPERVVMGNNCREQGGISLPVPLSPRGFGSLPESGSSLAPIEDAQVGISTVQPSGTARVGHGDDLNEGTGTRLATEPSSSDPKVGGDTEGYFQSVDVTDLGWCPSTHPFISVVDGRWWSLCSLHQGNPHLGFY